MAQIGHFLLLQDRFVVATELESWLHLSSCGFEMLLSPFVCWELMRTTKFACQHCANCILDNFCSCALCWLWQKAPVHTEHNVPCKLWHRSGAFSPMICTVSLQKINQLMLCQRCQCSCVRTQSETTCVACRSVNWPLNLHFACHVPPLTCFATRAFVLTVGGVWVIPNKSVRICCGRLQSPATVIVWCESHGVWIWMSHLAHTRPRELLVVQLDSMPAWHNSIAHVTDTITSVDALIWPQCVRWACVAIEIVSPWFTHRFADAISSVSGIRLIVQRRTLLPGFCTNPTGFKLRTSWLRCEHLTKAICHLWQTTQVHMWHNVTCELWHQSSASCQQDKDNSTRLLTSTQRIDNHLDVVARTSNLQHKCDFVKSWSNTDSFHAFDVFVHFLFACDCLGLCLHGVCSMPARWGQLLGVDSADRSCWIKRSICW